MTTRTGWVCALLAAGVLTCAPQAEAVEATGGVVTNYTCVGGTNWVAHVFRDVGTTSLDVRLGGAVEVLVVGGGGGGGQNGGGGGGAGGVIYSNAFPVIAGSNYTVTVGAGGPRHPNDATNPMAGGNSVFGALIALGGGGGSSRDNGGQGASGGSGGGGGGAMNDPRYKGGNGTAGQGNGGGNGVWPDQGVNSTGGGGGGAGSPGTAGVSQQAGNGGDGVYYAAFANLAGSPAGWFAGGGAGGRVVNGNNGTGGKGGGGDASASPVANTGGGGCGGGSGGPSYQVGGSGIVIVRYPAAPDSGLPWIANVGVTGHTDTSADLAGSLVSNGVEAASVTLYWATTDYTTNATDWATHGGSTNVGPYADGETFTNTVSGLSANTVYYWNHRAVNASGTVWAASSVSPSFKTLGPPSVDNGVGATLVRTSTARLNATLLDGAPAHVFLSWWADGSGATKVVELGLHELAGGVFANLTGLKPATAYSYRTWASNDYGTVWAPAASGFTTPSPAGSATGGVVTNYTCAGGTNWIAHIFTTVGTTNLNVTVGGEIEYLIVGGGGGGGSTHGGGGGAGGYLEGVYQVNDGQSYTIVVGNGGAGAGTGVPGYDGNSYGQNGQSSQFGTFTAYGGGGGASRNFQGSLANGGSGGGNADWTRDNGNAIDPAQGNDGGRSNAGEKGGGGGGAAAPGDAAVGSVAGAGGAGKTSSITGFATDYAGGGGGGARNGTGGSASYGGGIGGTTFGTPSQGANGDSNTGGGGGGGAAWDNGNQYTIGGNGGSGIVVVRYYIPPPKGTLILIR